jgi:hypothetical protein
LCDIKDYTLAELSMLDPITGLKIDSRTHEDQLIRR